MQFYVHLCNSWSIKEAKTLEKLIEICYPTINYTALSTCWAGFVFIFAQDSRWWEDTEAKKEDKNEMNGCKTEWMQFLKEKWNIKRKKNEIYEQFTECRRTRVSRNIFQFYEKELNRGAVEI